VRQNQRVQHRVKRVEHPPERRRQQRAPLLSCRLSQQFDGAYGHSGSDCSVREILLLYLR